MLRGGFSSIPSTGMTPKHHKNTTFLPGKMHEQQPAPCFAFMPTFLRFSVQAQAQVQPQAKAEIKALGQALTWPLLMV